MSCTNGKAWVFSCPFFLLSGSIKKAAILNRTTAFMSFYNEKDNHYLRLRANSPPNASRERVAVVGSGILTVRSP